MDFLKNVFRKSFFRLKLGNDFFDGKSRQSSLTTGCTAAKLRFHVVHIGERGMEQIDIRICTFCAVATQRELLKDGG